MHKDRIVGSVLFMGSVHLWGVLPLPLNIEELRSSSYHTIKKKALHIQLKARLQETTNATQLESLPSTRKVNSHHNY